MKVITSTWACKNKSNGTYHSQLDAKGFKQVAGKHFNPTSTAVPVTNDTTIRIVLVLMLLTDWMAIIYDEKGVFLKRKFDDSKEIFMEVPQCMEHRYWGSAVLRLLKPTYGLKQATLLFWWKLLEIMKKMGCKRNISDLCMYFSRNKTGELAMWLSWVDDNLIVEPPQVMTDEGKKWQKKSKVNMLVS